MHDIRNIKENPENFDANLAKRGLPPMAAFVLELDAQRRAAQTEMQENQAKRNELSKQVGELKKQGKNADEIMQQVSVLKDRLVSLETQEKFHAKKLKAVLSEIPNSPFPEVPVGKDEHDNPVIRTWGEPRKIENPKQHFELGEALGLMDFETAAKLSGARFTILKGALARLERALGDFMLDLHTEEFGYTEVSPPLLVKDEIMYGTGQLPKFMDDQFLAGTTKSRNKLLEEGLSAADTDDIEKFKTGGLSLTDLVSKTLFNAPIKEDLWLIPTAEVSLTNFVNDEIVEHEKLPMRMVARTPCWRAEAGAAGKDTRGMLRQHQFYKVELVSITAPEQSEKEHERMTVCAETVLKRLGLPFRTVVLCTGDMGFCSRKTYDLEVWMPGQNTYREISSCSNCEDFQARRMNARYRSADSKQIGFVHTLNGSGIAVGRCLIAVMENYQNSSGAIIIPEVLRPYMNGMEKIECC